MPLSSPPLIKRVHPDNGNRNPPYHCAASVVFPRSPNIYGVQVETSGPYSQIYTRYLNELYIQLLFLKSLA